MESFSCYLLVVVIWPSFYLWCPLVGPSTELFTPMPNFQNFSLHQALQSFMTEVREYFTRSGMMWQWCAALGSCGMLRSHTCVECTSSPSSSVTEIGCFSVLLLRTYATKTNKSIVAPEHNMTHFLIFCKCIYIVCRSIFGEIWGTDIVHLLEACVLQNLLICSLWMYIHMLVCRYVPC